MTAPRFAAVNSQKYFYT